MRHLAEESSAPGVILFVILQMLREQGDLLRQNRDLHLGRSRVLRMRAVLGDEVFFLRALDGHKHEGNGKEKPRASPS